MEKKNELIKHIVELYDAFESDVVLYSNGRYTDNDFNFQEFISWLSEKNEIFKNKEE